jgi:hypothetical protein
MELFPQNFRRPPISFTKQGIYWYIKWYQLTNQISLLSNKQVNVCDKQTVFNMLHWDELLIKYN